MRQILAPYGVEIVSAAELNLSDVEETGTTFAENAALKAEALAAQSGLPCLADDSGLCVAALDGRPGVYSARYAADNETRINKLLAELKQSGRADRSAYFACVLALKLPAAPIRFFEGRVNGRIIDVRRGNMGFGYDPVFVPDGETRTFAEMTNAEKSAISHRGRALAQFVREVFETA